MSNYFLVLNLLRKFISNRASLAVFSIVQMYFFYFSLSPYTHIVYLDDFYLMDFDLDGKLSQSEMKKTTPQIFMLLDSDGDGYVTEEELQHMMKVLQAKHDTLTGESENAN